MYPHMFLVRIWLAATTVGAVIGGAAVSQEGRWDHVRPAPTGLAGRGDAVIAVSVGRIPASADNATCERALDRFASARVAEMSQREPFKAAAYAGAGACLEKFKRAMAAGNAAGMADAAAELHVRLDLLETGRMPDDAGGLFDLLCLASQPEAQMVVEYPRGVRGTDAVGAVSFYWGAFPLAGALVQEYGSEIEAAKALDPRTSLGTVDLSEMATVAGRPARVQDRFHMYKAIDFAQFDPQRQVVLCRNLQPYPLVLDLDQLPQARPDGVVFLNNVSSDVRTKVEVWAAQSKLPIVSLDEGRSLPLLIVAGDPRTEDAFADMVNALATKMTHIMSKPTDIRSQPTRIIAVSGKRSITFTGSRTVGEQVLSLIVAGKPVDVAQVDAMRRTLAEELAVGDQEPAPDADGLQLYCGDVHMHTFHSDGSPSPAELVLQTLYCGMDFAVITDHNALEGARVARQLMERSRLAHRLIVGQEITTGEAHFSAYPLQDLVSWEISFEDIVKAAHAQGAVIQYNHPGYPNSRWGNQHRLGGIEGTGLDGWEHRPLEYLQWKEAGRLPLLIGSTDTHSGTFERLERTVILAPDCQGDDLADAIRRKQALMVFAPGYRYAYGSDEMIQRVVRALLEGKQLKEAKARQLRAVFKDFDLPELLRHSLPKPM